MPFHAKPTPHGLWGSLSVKIEPGGTQTALTQLTQLTQLTSLPTLPTILIYEIDNGVNCVNVRI